MKSAIGVFLAALVYFIWGMVSWMVLPWYNSTMSQLPEQQLIRDTLKVVIEKPGLYVFPCAKDENGKHDMEKVEEMAKTGPIGMMTIIPQGGPMMTPRQMIVSFVHGLLLASIIIWVMCLARGCLKTRLWRVILAAKLGGLTWLARDLPYWNWMYFPMGYTLVNLAHLLVGFTLMGVVLSYFVAEEK